jgi:hypothetical protein
VDTIAATVAGYVAILIVGDVVGGTLLRPPPRVVSVERLALAFALGVGVVSLLLFWGSLAAPGHAGTWCVVVPVLGLMLWKLGRRLRASGPRSADILRDPRTRLAAVSAPNVWSVAVALLLGAETLRVLAVSVAIGFSWDAWFIWALKARVVFVDGGVPRAYLADLSRQWSHLDYPWLLPLAEAWMYFVAGEVRPALAKVLFPGFFGCLVLLFYCGMRRDHSRPTSLFFAGSVGIVPHIHFWSPVGYADIVVGLYWLGSVLYLYHWLRAGAHRDLVAAAAFAALGAWTKNEGAVYWLLQLVAIALGSVLWGKPVPQVARGVGIHLLAGIVVVGPWVFLRMYDGVPGNDFGPVSLATTMAHLGRVPVLLTMTVRELADPWHWALLWYLVAGGLLLFWCGSERRARVYLAACTVVPPFVLGAVYVYSVWVPFTRHVEWSLDRLILQQAPVAMLFVATQVAGLRAERAALLRGT